MPPARKSRAGRGFFISDPDRFISDPRPFGFGLYLREIIVNPGIFLSAAVSGFLTVLLGAFGAHALKHSLTPAELSIWQTAVHYQMFHTAALLILGLMPAARQLRTLRLAGWCLNGGILLFSGSLYLLAVTGRTWLGAITPLGGLLFLLGWGTLACHAAHCWREARQ